MTFLFFLVDLQNRSTKLPSVSIKMQPDFLNPSKRSYLQNDTCLEKNGSPPSSKSEDLESICSEKFDLWPILVRTISFLLIRSRYFWLSFRTICYNNFILIKYQFH